MCQCVPDYPILFGGLPYFSHLVVAPQELGCGFFSFHTPYPQDLAACSIPHPAPPNPWAIQPTPQLWSAASNIAGKNSSWLARGLQGRAKGGRRNKNMLLEGQGQTDGRLQPFREWWEPLVTAAPTPRPPTGPCG